MELCWEKSSRKVDKDEVIAGSKDTQVATQLWRLKRGRRASRLGKQESKWYQQYGLNQKCSICGGPHPTMRKVIFNNGDHVYLYNCKIARWNQWPVDGVPIHKFTIWDSLETCPLKMAEYYHYDREEIEIALQQWETGVCGLLMSPENRNLFKGQVRTIYEEVRQSWTFKRSNISLPEEELDEEEDYEELTPCC